MCRYIITYYIKEFKSKKYDGVSEDHSGQQKK